MEELEQNKGEMDIGKSALLTDIAMCINYYRLFSPGLYCCIKAPVELAGQSKIYPDLIAMVNYGMHKQCDPSDGYHFFKGPPNFVLDVYSENEVSEYEEKRKVLEDAKVVEYVALFDTQPLQFYWNTLSDGKFINNDEDESGMVRSLALPGLWIPAESLRTRNWWSIMGAIAQGVSRKPHHEMMATIWK